MLKTIWQYKQKKQNSGFYGVQSMELWDFKKQNNVSHKSTFPKQKYILTRMTGSTILHLKGYFL